MSIYQFLFSAWCGVAVLDVVYLLTQPRSVSRLSAAGYHSFSWHDVPIIDDDLMNFRVKIEKSCLMNSSSCQGPKVAHTRPRKLVSWVLVPLRMIWTLHPSKRANNNKNLVLDLTFYVATIQLCPFLRDWTFISRCELNPRGMDVGNLIWRERQEVYRVLGIMSCLPSSIHDEA